MPLSFDLQWQPRWDHCPNVKEAVALKLVENPDADTTHFVQLCNESSDIDYVCKYLIMLYHMQDCDCAYDLLLEINPNAEDDYYEFLCVD